MPQAQIPHIHVLSHEVYLTIIFAILVICQVCFIAILCIDFVFKSLVAKLVSSSVWILIYWIRYAELAHRLPLPQRQSLTSFAFPRHDDVIQWKYFPRYWPFMRGIHRSPVSCPHKGQWRGPLMFSLVCALINSWINNREAGDLRGSNAHYDVTNENTSTKNGFSSDIWEKLD